jgi:hypothetical protein
LRGHKVLIGVVAAAALTLGAMASYVISRPEAPPAIDGLLWPQSKALTAFALEDHHREALRRREDCAGCCADSGTRMELNAGLWYLPLQRRRKG